MPVPRKRLLSRCPFRDRVVHTAVRPATLSQVGVKHITHQIEKNGYKTLPYRIHGEHFYLCRDCCAVRLGSSPYTLVAEAEVLGIYDRSLVWKPYP